MFKNNEMLHLLESSEEDDSDSSFHKRQPKSTATPPSGISNLFNNYRDELKPLNAFIATTKPPPILRNQQQTSDQDISSSSYRSSAYFTASLPNSVFIEDNWNNDNQIEEQTAVGIATKSPSSPHYLSRTMSSSNYFDNQSDYEVILDDGTRQKRTISLSTVQLYPSHHSSNDQIKNSNNEYLSILGKWITKKSGNNNRNISTSKRLATSADNSTKSNIPLSLSSSSDDDGDDDQGDDSNKKRRKCKHLFNTSSLKRYTRHWSKIQNQYLILSHKQKMVLKCSFAYMIGSLFTFVPQLNALCGTHIASHMAATVTVFFNPAKTVGGMVEAAGFGWLYTIAALTLSLASMYTTDYFLDNDMELVAYCVSLGVWLAGSTFAISYLKAKLNTPSVMTASGLAFIILFTVIVREGSGNEAEFDLDIITETFAIVAIGTIISVATCVLIWPMTATKKLRTNIDSSLSSTRILLKLLTKTFLLDADLPEFTANKTLETALKTHRASFTALKPALKDANLEFYNLEMQYHSRGYKTIVKSIERLAQHIGGLKSSCGLQVEVMQQTTLTTPITKVPGYGSINDNNTKPTIETSTSSNKEMFNLKAGPQRKKMESELKKQRQKRDQSTTIATSPPFDYFSMASDEENTLKTSQNKKEGALVQFICTVRSPMKSLAYTCKQTIVHLQARFTKKTTQTTPSFRLMRQNLASAIELFETSQHKALMLFYKRKFKKQQPQNLKSDELHSLFLKQKQNAADDVFLVYFFVFCLLEFAKELMTLVESVQYVFEDMEESDQSERIFPWIKYLFKRNSDYYTSDNDEEEDKPKDTSFTPNNHNTLNTLHTPAPDTKVRKLLLKLWSFFSEFRTYRVKFAVKSMLTAEIISILAFIPATRPSFTEFKLEWTLITVMAVMTPTVGGTNLGAILRVIATILGCVLAAIIYTIFQDNSFMLWLCTWLISIPSFWLILHHKHGRFGLFTLLAYNLIVLYKFNHRLDDSVDVFELTWMRCLAVSVGVILGLFVTAYVWPYEARREVRKGLSDLLLRLSWLYKQLVSVYSEDDLSEVATTTATTATTATTTMSKHIGRYSGWNKLLLSRKNKTRAAELQKIELSIQVSIFDLQGLLIHAPNEPRLKGPFPVKTYSAMLACCQSILDKLLSLRIVILKDVWAVHVRRNFLMPASQEFLEMAGNVFLYFYLLASALQLKTPLPPYLPPAEKTRQLLMQKLQQLPLVMEMSIQEHELTEEKKDECYMVYYAYVILMENIIRELELLGNHMKDLFGSLVPEDQWMRCFGQNVDLEQNRITL